MTQRKALAAGTGINPKLTKIAAKVDEAHAHAWRIESHQTGDYDVDAAECAREKACGIIWKLDVALARTAALNLEEMKLKARYADIVSGDTLASESIIRDLRALSPPRPPQIRP